MINKILNFFRPKESQKLTDLSAFLKTYRQMNIFCSVYVIEKTLRIDIFRTTYVFDKNGKFKEIIVK